MSENLLKQKRLRVTPFRMSVLDVFYSHKNAISLHEIEKDLGKFDRVTLYRTIKSFIEKGLIHEIVMPGDIKKLALCPDSCSKNHHVHTHQHIHFRCTKCETVSCIDIENFPQINIPRFQLDKIEIQGSGICQNCLKN